MKKSTILIPIILIGLLSSCVYSLYPVVTADTAYYSADLEGTWQLSDDDATITFYGLRNPLWNSMEEIDSVTSVLSNGDTLHYPEDVVPMLASVYSDFGSDANTRQDSLENGYFSYLIEIEGDGKKFGYHGTIANINDSYYLDLTYVPLDVLDFEPGPYQVTMPVHSFVRIGFADNGDLELTDFDLTKLRSLFREGQIRMKHEDLNDEILITASTEDLQKFLATYGQDPSVFNSTDTYEKVNP